MNFRKSVNTFTFKIQLLVLDYQCFNVFKHLNINYIVHVYEKIFFCENVIACDITS